jgi:hypothetical protein
MRAVPNSFLLLLGCLMGMGPAVRAQVTETPYPLAPGRLIIRMDGLNLRLDHRREDGGSFTGLGLANTLVAAGLSDAVDLQVGATLLVRQRYELGGRQETHSGVGEMVFRAKIRVWSEPTWGAAVALLPYVRVPSRVGAADGRRPEFGLIVPWETALPAGFTLGAMAQADLRRATEDPGRNPRWSAAALVQRPLPAGLRVYAESRVAAAADASARAAGQLGAGAAWRVNRVLEVEYELLRGLNDAATDWQHVLRLNWSW